MGCNVPRLRLAGGYGHRFRLRRSMKPVTRRSPTWKDGTRNVFTDLRQAPDGTDSREAGRSENAFIGAIAVVLILASLIAKAVALNMSPILTALAILGLAATAGIFALVGHIVSKKLR